MTTTYPEPIWGLPQEAEKACSSIDATGVTPYMLTGILVSLTQYHFGNNDNITNPSLKSLAWVPGGCNPSQATVNQAGETEHTDGNIFIGPSTTGDASSAGAVPSILVKREAYTSAPLGGNNVQEKKGAPQHMTFAGTHSIICKGKTGAEADAIAEEVSQRMLHYMSVIRDDFRLGLFQPTGVSDVKEMGQEAEKVYYAVVRIKWGYVYKWTLKLEAPQIKRTKLTYIE